MPPKQNAILQMHDFSSSLFYDASNAASSACHRKAAGMRAGDKEFEADLEQLTAKLGSALGKNAMLATVRRGMARRHESAFSRCHYYYRRQDVRCFRASTMM